MHSINSSGRLNVGKQIEIFVGRMCSPDGVSGNCLPRTERRDVAIVCALECTSFRTKIKKRLGRENHAFRPMLYTVPSLFRQRDAAEIISAYLSDEKARKLKVALPADSTTRPVRLHGDCTLRMVKPLSSLEVDVYPRSLANNLSI
jgi:hypothetical protein